MDLDEIADRLYSLPVAEFIAAREAEARAAKQAGQPDLARLVAALRKPTVAAWAVNQLSRAHPAALAELLDLGEELRAAWAAQDAEALAELTARRSRLSRRLLRLAPSAGAEVEQTLDAATVDADAAEEVRRGRLAKPLSYSGFAPAPVAKSRPARKPSEEDRRAAEDRRAKELAEATAAHEEWRATLAQAVQERDERAAKVADLEKKLAKARRKLAEAEQRAEVARREEAHARARLNR
ncbi:hypothetical protein ACFXJ8_32325 [Nonomuraea sp. NPDC059194]|uniref:hypothetical protein n=1 Tax=Nonomuraea sp. NPDC059194 TaxID=3346764 RepID=UPI0036928BF5